MSTGRMQKRLQKLNAIEKDINDMPASYLFEQEKADFLKKIQALRTDISASKNRHILLQDLDALHDEYNKLAKKIVSAGQQKLAEKIAAYTQNLDDIQVLQKKLDELSAFVSVFKKVEANTSPSITLASYRNKSSDDMSEKTNKAEDEERIVMKMSPF